MLFSPDEIAANSREATARGIATASQDSVDEVNGMLTVSTMHTRAIMEGTQILVQNSAAQLQHLANIEANTFELHAMREDLAAMRVDMGYDLRSVHRTLVEIKDKGVPMN